MSKETREKLEKVFDVLGELIAFVTAVVWALVIIDQNFSFLPAVVVNVFNVVKAWLLLVLVGVVGFEATIKRNFIIRIIFYVILAILIIFHCFPGTYDYLIGLVK
jgi:predicted membrane-bound spermidine synthase